MITNWRYLLPAGLGLVAGVAWGEGPNLGYLYPAGGQRGTTVEIVAGGQFLAGVNEVLVSGEGVEAEVVKHYRPVRNLNADQRRLLMQKLQAREDVLTDKPGNPAAAPAKGRPKNESASPRKKEQGAAPPVTLPAHPMLEQIEQMDARGLEVVRRTFLNRMRYQPNPQIAELVTMRVTIAADALPGDRAIRLVTAGGLSNPVCFQVGLMPEWREVEPNEPRMKNSLQPVAPLNLPVVVNGQILPGDLDRIRFQAKKDEPLVVDARARQLIPYLADAVPGWFQLAVAVLDESGREVAFADDFRFHPDPLFRCVIPADGIYQLEVRDAIYRGREDFVYRIRLGRVPVITEVFPLGTGQGRAREAQVRGWNLPKEKVELQAGPQGGAVREVALTTDEAHTNAVPYAIDPPAGDGMEQVVEHEPNNSESAPQVVTLPAMLNGRIGEPGDLDVFRFEGRQSQELVAEVQARVLNSPLDSTLSLIDARGVVVAWNDDHMEKGGHLHLGAGLVTHHADSYLRARLPADGSYCVVLGDAQGHGGSAYAYRLRLAEPKPGFRVMVTPSTVQVPRGGQVPLRFHIVRLDGFAGPVKIELGDGPRGFRLHGAIVPPGEEEVRATLESPAQSPDGIIELKFRARASEGGREFVSEVQPVDDRMQAFLWRHLVTADKFLVKLTRKHLCGLALESNAPALLKPGSSIEVRIVTKGGSLPPAVRLEASEPPEGISVTSSPVRADGFFLTIHADESLKPGLMGNLIVEGWMTPPAKKGKSRPQLVGALPAIPFQTIAP